MRFPGVTDLWQNLQELGFVLGRTLASVWHLVAAWLLLIAWIAWWLRGVNWRRAWGVLAQGAWLPLVAVAVAGALVWSQIAPASGTVLGVHVPNFWWQLGGVGLLAGLTLFCGYLQGVLGWTPEEVEIEPAHIEHDVHGHSHDPGHGHHGHAAEPTHVVDHH
jgi:hypothetical protein